ncbi:MAG: ABC transporter permease [Acidobacteriaceae bacterium]|nr:ABC transporter permease [Acidobacteriaceae bacterium]
MAKRALSWSRAAAIAGRDLKSAPGKFAFVVLSVAVGVAALVGVRGFSESFKRTLTVEARSLMGGDLSARIFRIPSKTEQQKVDALDARLGAQSTWSLETISMASAPPDPVPLLVTLKAVDPAQYPYYGAAELEPAMPLTQALVGDSAVVAEEFLIRLNAHVGGTLKLGGRVFRIAAVLRQEPDRMSAGAGMGPRVMISRSALERTGLTGEGSRASQRLLLKLPSKADPVAVRKQVEAILPDAQVMDFKEGNPALSDGLDRATAILSLICLVAMVLGAIGVAMAMHAHLEQRMDMLAILKAVGARAGDLLRIFLLQTLALGLAGGVAGVVAGGGVMLALPTVFGKLLPVHTAMTFPWRSAAAGLGTGLLTTLLFSLPPLLDVRAVRPVLVLRRLVEQGPATTRAWFARWWARRLQLFVALLVVAALGGVAWVLADSPMVGGVFAAVFAVTLVVLVALAAVTLRVLRWLLNRVRLHLPSSLRHGLANLYRPGNQSAAVLAALGTGVMLILTVYLTQGTLLRGLRDVASPKLPNVFLIDMTSDEVAGVRALFARQPGVTEPLDLLPMVTGHFVSLNGKTLDRLQTPHFPRRMLESAELSWADTVPAGDTLTQGKWWTQADAQAIAVSQGTAERLNLGLGSAVQLEVGERVLTLKVAALFRPDGEHVSSRVAFVLPSTLLKDEPATWYGGAHVQVAQIPAMERALFAAYPTVTVINLADMLDRVEAVVDQITFVVRFLAGFSILAGLMILASSIASARFRRMREAVVLKTLGATRMRIVRTFSVEFSVLGLLAGTVGVASANVLTRILADRLKLPYHLDWTATLTALAGTALLAVATGWIASYRILGLRPLEVLREE